MGVIIKKISNEIKKIILNTKKSVFLNYSGGEWINKEKLYDCEILIATVGFNSVKLIEYQNKFVKKKLVGQKNKLVYFVADNSHDEEKSCEIRKYCNMNSIPYVRLSKSPYIGTEVGSESHGLALDWICKNVVNKYKNIKVIGFVDHDCFPISKSCDRLWNAVDKQGFYGLRQERGDYWYLWPGFTFIDVSKIDISSVDFCPNGKGDTGSGIGDFVLEYLRANHMQESEIEFPDQVYVELLDKKMSQYTQDTCIEVFDGEFVHLMNGSNWLKSEIYSTKGKLVEQYLNKFL